MLCAGDDDNEEGTNVEMKMRGLTVLAMKLFREWTTLSQTMFSKSTTKMKCFYSSELPWKLNRKLHPLCCGQH